MQNRARVLGAAMVIVAVVLTMGAIPSRVEPARVAFRQSTPFSSQVSSPNSTAEVDSAQATIAALLTQAAAIPLTATAQAAAQATISALSTQVSSMAQTATVGALPSPTPVVQAGTVLYEANDAAEFKAWMLIPGWRTLDGMLVSDGTGPDTIRAPYQPGVVSDYAIEVEIQVVSVTDCYNGRMGIAVRGTAEGEYQGRIIWMACDSIAAQIRSWNGKDGRTTLAEEAYTPDMDWHTFRVEVEGNSIRLLIDGNPIIATTDNTHLSGGTVGVWSFGIQISVRSVRVIAL